MVALLQPSVFDRRDPLESLSLGSGLDGRSVGRGLDRFYIEKITVHPKIWLIGAELRSPVFQGSVLERIVTMRLDKLTSKLQTALADAQSLALGRDHNQIRPEHLMLVLIDQKGGTVRPLPVSYTHLTLPTNREV